MRSIRDLIRRERGADMRKQWKKGVAHCDFENRTYWPIARGLYAGWRRSQRLLALHARVTGQPIIALSRVFEVANGR